MKKFFATILFSVIAVVSFGQSKTFTIIDNNVYEISHNESGQKVYTELGALDNNAISFSNNKVPNYKTGWKFAKSVGLDYSYALTEYNDIVQKAMREWKEMRDKRENLEISDEEYLEWKLNYEIEFE